MELKCGCSLVSSGCVPYRSNRTFMELKFCPHCGKKVRVGGSNRTFMELK